MKRRTLLAAALAAPSFAAPSIVRAQAAWPAKPVRFICPFAPGGGTDTVSRLMSDQLSKILGQTFVVENKGGAGGNIGTVELARATPDGYTVGLISVASHTLNPMLYSKLPYDADKDIVGISRVAILANLLGVTPSLPANTVAELIALCKAAPEIPAIGETVPGYVATSWYGIGAPAGTPEPILAKLEAAIAEALKAPEIQKRWADDLGLDLPPPGRKGFDQFVAEDRKLWAPAVKASGVKLD